MSNGGDLVMRAEPMSGDEARPINDVGETHTPLRSGRGAEPNAIDGSLVFQMADGREVICFEPNGEVRIRGQVVDSNLVVYEELRAWLRCATEKARANTSVAP